VRTGAAAACESSSRRTKWGSARRIACREAITIGLMESQRQVAI
jgi:hypothetical protein